MTDTETSIIPKKLFHNMANGYALATSALLAIFCASLCNLPPHNGFLDHYYHGAQSGEIVFRPPVFSEQMSMLEYLLSFHVVVFENLGGSSVQSFSRGVLNTAQKLPVLLIQLFI